MNITHPTSSPDISVIHGKPVTTSMAVTSYFGKRHDNVLRSIDNLECSDNFRALNFEETSISVLQPRGGSRQVQAFNMTKNGFVFLAMGFTGKKAAQFKEAYIAEFDRMDAELNRSRIPDTLGDLVGTATAHNLNQLVDRLQKIVIEGEFIPKGGRAVRYVIEPNRKTGRALIGDFMACSPDSPVQNLLALLSHDGHDIKAVEQELKAARNYIVGLTTAISDIQTHAQYINYAVGKIE